MNTWDILKKGLQDYYYSHSFNGVLLGLSGGMDSAFVAVLAAEALGARRVNTMMMKTKYTTKLSIDIARQLAKTHRFHYREISIQSRLEHEIRAIELESDRKPSPLTIENMQARIRGMRLMTESNENGHLVLACGNKSEIAMGYCTLYGDTCGGLAPIGDVYKSDLYAIARQQNELKGYDFFPSKVLDRPPSAELSSGQTDADTLPSYDVLDGILKKHIEQGSSIEDLIKEGYDEKIVPFVINRYKTMAFKRAQMAPTIKIKEN